MKLPARYLARLAIVYIRQSTEKQVLVNEGSRQHQEDQRQFALRYGWRPDMIRVISKDLGLSGLRSDRPGYLEMLDLIRSGQVGALFISDVSRAGREERAWFDLLALLIEHDVLLIKNGAVTEPQDESQAFATKIELVVVARENRIRLTNVHRGRLAKAGKGKAVSAPPIGYIAKYEIRDGKPVNSGVWELDPNKEVRDAIDAAFSAFREAASLHKAVDLLIQRGVEIPARRGRPSRRKPGSRFKDGIRWEQPAVWNVRRFLKHPAYAGVYLYGRRHWKRVQDGGDPVPDGRLIGKFVEVPNHHQGYISLDEYVANQRTLALNTKGPGQSQAGPGPATLQGRCRCAKHGAMVVHYHRLASGGRGWSFRCLGDYLLGGEQCICVPGIVLEQSVVAAVWEALDVPVVEEAERLWRAAKTQWGQQNHGLQADLDRKLKARERVRLLALEEEDGAFPRYRAMLADEYERLDTDVEKLRQRIAREDVAVDPFNEVRWSELKALCADVKAIWNATTTTDLDRKQLIRLLIDKVVIDAVEPETIRLHIEWADGRPHKHIVLLRSPYFHRLMWQWHRSGVDAQDIVARLRDMGARTQQGHAWSLETVKKTLAILTKRSPTSDTDGQPGLRPWQVMLELEATGLKPAEIADRLNADGLLTRFHAPWSASSLQRVLHDKRTIVRHHSELTCPASASDGRARPLGTTSARQP